jgi:hypothetical protein
MKTKALPDVTISGLALSDLFFNAEHPLFDTAMENDGIEAASIAILDDAREFTRMLGNLDESLAEQLAADFMERL